MSYHVLLVAGHWPWSHHITVWSWASRWWSWNGSARTREGPGSGICEESGFRNSWKRKKLIWNISLFIDWLIRIGCHVGSQFQILHQDLKQRPLASGTKAPALRGVNPNHYARSPDCPEIGFRDLPKFSLMLHYSLDVTMGKCKGSWANTQENWFRHLSPYHLNQVAETCHYSNSRKPNAFRTKL